MSKKMNEKIESVALSRWQSPSVINLLLKPRQFFASLSELPENPYRYVHFRFFITSALVLGAYGFLGNNPVREALQEVGGPLPPSLAGMMVVSLFSWLWTWFLHWKIMGWLLGKEARTGEIYGVTLLVPLLISSLLFMPILLVPVQLQVPLPEVSSLQGADLKDALTGYRHDLYRELKRVPVRRALQAVSLLVTVWSYFLAYLGLFTITKNPRKAILGSVLPAALIILLTLLE